MAPSLSMISTGGSLKSHSLPVSVEEEVLDTILLVIRNAVQFLRLGNILRRSQLIIHPLIGPGTPY